MRYLAAFVILAGLGLALLGPVSWLIAGSTVRDIKDPKDRAAAVNQVQVTVGALLGTGAGLGAVTYTIRGYHLSRRGQVTERYGKAVTQLASTNVVERLGGVYALEHVMRESEEDHQTVVEVLAAFVRNASPVRPGRSVAGGPREDVTAAVTVLARRPVRPEKHRIDLRRSDLTGLELLPDRNGRCPRLAGADLCGVRLTGARMPGAELADAWLAGADLAGADLRGADLSGAWLTGAVLRETVLREARLVAAKLDEAVLDRTHFDRADLSDSWLNRATQRGAWLDGTTLTRAWLCDVDLRGSQGLNEEQLLQAGYLANTRPPAHLENRPRLARLATDWANRPQRHLPTPHPFPWPLT
ncbi:MULTISPECIES: pentapeptide repeat-containing protein [unclassified Streptomyces]|uniref:pentapeptide repeat-containing protein n=1 Tax=unclassified Streptomyces TaxID=2593676 RepID=UPI0036E1BF81